MKKTLSTLLGAAALAACFLPSAAEAQTGYQYYAVTPCRLVDTRLAAGAPGNQGQVGTSGAVLNRRNVLFTSKGFCGVPASAVAAVSVNVTIATPTDDGHLRIFPADVAQIGAFSTINFVAGESAVANGAIVPVQSTGTTTGPAGPTAPGVPAFGGNFGTGDFGVFLGGGPPGTGTANVHVIVDVTGYFQ